MKELITCASLAVLAFAGCSSSSPEDFGAAEVSLGSVPSLLEIDYDDTANTITLTDGTITTVLPVRPAAFYDTPGFFGYYQGSGGPSYASRGETSTGSGYAISVISADTASNVAGAVFGRLGDTTMPTSGTAQYTGDYVAWVATSSDNVGQYLIYGDATLDVDFDSAMVDGLITNRTDNFSAGNPLNDLTFETTSISDGGFTGTTSGGAFALAGWTAAAGEYGGVFTGADGQEIAGGVQVTHVRSGTALVEAGAFIVED